MSVKCNTPSFPTSHPHAINQGIAAFFRMNVRISFPPEIQSVWGSIKCKRKLLNTYLTKSTTEHPSEKDKEASFSQEITCERVRYILERQASVTSQIICALLPGMRVPSVAHLN